MRRYERTWYNYTGSYWYCPWCGQKHINNHQWCDHNHPNGNLDEKTVSDNNQRENSNSPATNYKTELAVLKKYITLATRKKSLSAKEKLEKMLKTLSGKLLSNENESSDQPAKLVEILIEKNEAAKVIQETQALANAQKEYYKDNKQAVEFIDIITGDDIRQIFAKDDKKDEKAQEKETKEKSKPVDEKDTYEVDDIKTKVRDYWTHGELYELIQYIKNDLIGKKNDESLKECKSLIEKLEKSDLLKDIKKLINIQNTARGELKRLPPKKANSSFNKEKKEKSTDDMLKEISKDVGEDDEDTNDNEDDNDLDD